MPQLDKFSFFTQIFWVFIVICVLYYIFFNYFLPLLSSTIKYRVKNIYNLQLQQTWYISLLNNSIIIYFSLLNIILENFILISNFYKNLHFIYFNNILEKKSNDIYFK